MSTISPGPHAGNPLRPEQRQQLRALTDATIAAARIYCVADAAESTQLLRWKGHGPAPAIAFPNFGKDGVPNSILLRPDTPVVRKDGTAPEYESPKGMPQRLYFSPLVAVETWGDASIPLLFVNGIENALAAAQVGVAAISAQRAWHDVAHRHETKEWKLHPDFEGVPLRGRRVLIACRDGARLARMLREAGADVRLVRLPFGDRGVEVGLAGYLTDQPDASGALMRLIADAVEMDPVTRAEAVPDARAALDLLHDASFVASVQGADQATRDVACRLLTKHGIRRAAFERAVTPPSPPRPAEEPSQQSTVRAPDPFILADALELLHAPDLLARFAASVQRGGLIGEERPALLLLLAAVTRKSPNMSDHLHIAVKGASSTGKNTLVQIVGEYVPPEDLIIISAMSRKALQYMPEPLSGKLVVLVEQNAADDAEYALRISMSEGYILTHTVEKDETTGKFGTVECRVEAKATFVSTTTRYSLHPENETRVLEVTLDESASQTYRIIDDCWTKPAPPAA